MRFFRRTGYLLWCWNDGMTSGVGSRTGLLRFLFPQQYVSLLFSVRTIVREDFLPARIEVFSVHAISLLEVKRQDYHVGACPFD